MSIKNTDENKDRKVICLTKPSDKQGTSVALQRDDIKYVTRDGEIYPVYKDNTKYKVVDDGEICPVYKDNTKYRVADDGEIYPVNEIRDEEVKANGIRIDTSDLGYRRNSILALLVNSFILVLLSFNDGTEGILGAFYNIFMMLEVINIFRLCVRLMVLTVPSIQYLLDEFLKINPVVARLIMGQEYGLFDNDKDIK